MNELPAPAPMFRAAAGAPPVLRLAGVERRFKEGSS